MNIVLIQISEREINFYFISLCVVYKNNKLSKEMTKNKYTY